MKFVDGIIFTLLLQIAVEAGGINLDSNNICKYTICKMNNDSTYHKYHATIRADSLFDSLIIMFRERTEIKDTSVLKLDTLSGKLFSEAKFYMVFPIIKKLNEEIEAYCKKRKIDIFLIYPRTAIQYANNRTNYYPDSTDSLYINKLIKCSIPDVTDSIIFLLNNDLKIKGVNRAIEKSYKKYKVKLDLKIQAILNSKNK
jgi:hypothetical protein